MKSKTLSLSPLLLAALPLGWGCLAPIRASEAAPQEPIRYHLSFANRDHHEAEVSVVFSHLPEGPLEIRMSRTSPGRYSLHEFAKNVYAVRAEDGASKPLPIERPDLHQWTVSDHDGTVRFHYTLYGDRTDGTYVGIDSSHAHLNAPATFVWARGLEERPIEIRFDLEEAWQWRLATQLVPQTTSDEGGPVLSAPDLASLLDSPIELSDHERHEWQLRGPDDRVKTMALVLHHRGTEEEGAAYLELAKAVVDEEIRIYGEPPPFDHGTYTFLADYLPWASGDGMEHRNSTVITSSGSLRSSATSLLATIAHEFFHAWNIERLRPKSLEPFALEHANVSGELWFGEGFTSYYDGLVLKRIGVLSLERYAEQLARDLNDVLPRPGRRYASPVEMSRLAPFVDRASWNDPTNQSNTFISYYTYGSVLGLALDLSLRSRFAPLSLDDYMRAAWRRFGRSEVPYTLEDLESLLAEVTGDSAYAHDVFSRYVYESELPDYEALLRNAGLELKAKAPDRAWLGSPGLEYSSRGARLNGPTLEETPLYLAGLDRDDLIVEIDGQRPISRDRLDQILEGLSPGDTVEIRFEKRGTERRAEVELSSDPSLELALFETAGRAITPAIAAFRSSWLESAEAPQLFFFCPEDGQRVALPSEFCPVHGSKLRLLPAD